MALLRQRASAAPLGHRAALARRSAPKTARRRAASVDWRTTTARACTAASSARAVGRAEPAAVRRIARASASVGDSSFAKAAAKRAAAACSMPVRAMGASIAKRVPAHLMNAVRSASLWGAFAARASSTLPCTVRVGRRRKTSVNLSNAASRLGADSPAEIVAFEEPAALGLSALMARAAVLERSLLLASRASVSSDRAHEGSTWTPIVAGIGSHSRLRLCLNASARVTQRDAPRRITSLLCLPEG